MGTDDFKKYCSSPWDAVILLMVPAEKLRPTSIPLQLIVTGIGPTGSAV